MHYLPQTSRYSHLERPTIRKPDFSGYDSVKDMSFAQKAMAEARKIAYAVGGTSGKGKAALAVGAVMLLALSGCAEPGDSCDNPLEVKVPKIHEGKADGKYAETEGNMVPIKGFGINTEYSALVAVPSLDEIEDDTAAVFEAIIKGDSWKDIVSMAGFALAKDHILAVHSEGDLPYQFWDEARVTGKVENEKIPFLAEFPVLEVCKAE